MNDKHEHLCEICGPWFHEDEKCILETSTSCPQHVLGEEGILPQSNGTSTWRDPFQSDGFGPPTLIRSREVDEAEQDDRPGPAELLPLEVREARSVQGRVISMTSWMQEKINKLQKENEVLRG